MSKADVEKAFKKHFEEHFGRPAPRVTDLYRWFHDNYEIKAPTTKKKTKMAAYKARQAADEKKSKRQKQAPVLGKRPATDVTDAPTAPKKTNVPVKKGTKRKKTTKDPKAPDPKVLKKDENPKGGPTKKGGGFMYL